MNPNIEWGIGIEHETYILNREIPQKVIGSDIIENLEFGDETIMLEPFIDKVINTDKYYKYYETETCDGLGIINLLRRPNNIQKCVENLDIIDDLEKYKLLFGIDKDLETTYKNIITNITGDYTLFVDVPEFKNVYYKNKIISDSIYEIQLQHDIVIKSLQLLLNKKLFLPKVGALFPVKNNDNYIIDYTGSYHLNLSIPYDKYLLESEKIKYDKKKNSIKNLILNYLDKDINVDIDYFSNLENIFFDKYNYLSKISNFSYYLNQIQNRNQSLIDLYKNTDNDYFCFIIRPSTIKFIFLSNIRLGILFKQKRSLTNIYQFSLDSAQIGDYEDINILEYPYLKFLVPIYDFIDKVRNSHKYSQFNFLLIKDSKLYLTNAGGAKLVIFKDIPSLRLTKILDLPPSWNRNISNFMRNYYVPLNKGGILKKIYIPEGKEDINSKLNLHNLYQKGGFHHFHKIWAIAIQFIIPIILACFSSCDPLSIGDNNKLSELSFRLFISGYSFINLADVYNYNIPDDRELLINRKTDSKLIEYFKNKFPYWSKDQGIDGSEFRRDPNRLFNFGFELRMFDNFDILNINVLLEILFLLADHLKVLNIPKKGFKINPFNNTILNIEIEKICIQGWNSLISKSYVKLIRENLKIDINWHYHMNAYDMCNKIYVYLQRKYIYNGKGKGPFTRYLLDREPGIKQIPNINLLSWNLCFKNLFWEPKSFIYRRINIILSQSRNRKEFTHNLIQSLPSNYRFDIEDILYALKYLKIL